MAVPARAEQIATLACLIPYSVEEAFTAIDLGCGQGALGATILRCYPRASLVALDGSPAMLRKAAALLSFAGERAVTAPFELDSSEWLELIDGTGCVLSSLALHHLDGPAKKHLFQRLHDRISARGALLMADLVDPQMPQARDLFAQTWDRSARDQAGSGAGFERFLETHWNHFYFPGEGDTPSPLYDQLRWLEGAGFAAVDCFWMQAGHAIYGGFKGAGAFDGEGIDYELALVEATEVLAQL
ncbi:MAG: class I SAM-dependent methyltransferase [Actinomycetota bacterium]|nr:class I SAM-dependent methyltransferase [Actinomycetota bacterium]